MHASYETIGKAIVDLSPQPSTAAEFLRSISPLSEPLQRLNDGADAPLLFRGHGRASFRLLPSAFREHGPLRKLSFPYQRLLATVSAGDVPPFESFSTTQIYREAHLLRVFLERLNEVGLPLPTDLDTARSKCEEVILAIVVAYGLVARSKIYSPELFPFVWPPSELMTSLSFAQHYRVPSRLLDFTTSQHHAAYFAAEKWSENLPHDDRFAVICLRPDRLPQPNGSPLSSLRCEAPARFGNSNAAAQFGMFVFQRQGWPGGICGLPKLSSWFPQGPLDDVEYGQVEEIGIRITCPMAEGERVLKLLAQMGVEKRHVYPHPWTIADELVRELEAGKHSGVSTNAV